MTGHTHATNSNNALNVFHMFTHQSLNQASVQPVSLTNPILSHAMGKVHDDNQLDEYEGQSANQAHPHHGRSEGSIRYENGRNRGAKANQKFQRPKFVLDVRTRIPGALHAQHNDGHQSEEAGETEAEPIDSHITQSIFTVQLQRSAR